MPSPSANLTMHGLQNLVWGIASDETGGICQSFNNTRKADTKEIRNINGDFTAAASGFGRKGDLRYSLYSTVTTSVMGITTSLGASLTIMNTASNVLTGNGIANAVNVLQSLAVALSNQDFIKEDVGASVYDFGTGGT